MNILCNNESDDSENECAFNLTPIKNSHNKNNIKSFDMESVFGDISNNSFDDENSINYSPIKDLQHPIKIEPKNC